VKYEGAEAVNGIACYVYTCTFGGSMGGQNWAGNGKFCIRAADGLLQQSDSDFKIGNYAGNSKIVCEYTQDFKIEKPAM
jgi:hypothetical protein